MSDSEVHEKSPNETVGQFLAWMFKKSVCDGGEVLGMIDGFLYSISPNTASLAEAVDQYLNFGEK